MNAKSEMTDREMIASRLVSAPRALVWRLWTDPHHVAQWWGPNGFTNTIHEMDFRPGGRWSLIMHGPDGTDYPNEWIFAEIVEPERIVMDHASHPKFRFSVTFTEEKGKTLVSVRMVFDDPKILSDVVQKHGAFEGLKQNLERMEAHAAAPGAPSDEFVIAREFNAPPEVLWRAWTDPAHLAKWWGPKCMATRIEAIDARPGGKYRFVMRGEDGTEFPMEGVFSEVVEPSKLAYTVDVSGHPPEWFALVRRGLPPGHCGDLGNFINTVTFEPRSGRTLVTVRMKFVSSAVRDAMVKLGATSGWSSSLDRLVELLPRLAS